MDGVFGTDRDSLRAASTESCSQRICECGCNEWSHATLKLKFRTAIAVPSHRLKEDSNGTEENTSGVDDRGQSHTQDACAQRNEDKRNRATTETDSRSHVSASFQAGCVVPLGVVVRAMKGMRDFTSTIGEKWRAQFG